MSVTDTVQATASLSRGSLSYTLRKGGESCIVFLHGLGCSNASFRQALQANYFEPRFTLLAPDFMGHGHSARGDRDSYDLGTQANLIAELLDHLRMRRIAIVAHSMANIVGLELSSKPFQLFGYFCLEGNLIAEDCKLSARIVQLSEKEFTGKFYPMARSQFRCPETDSDPFADPVALYQFSRALVESCADDEPLKIFLELNAPKAYLHGHADLSVLAKLESVEALRVPEAGHFLMNDNPDFVYREIAKRLAA